MIDMGISATHSQMLGGLEEKDPAENFGAGRCSDLQSLACAGNALIPDEH